MKTSFSGMEDSAPSVETGRLLRSLYDGSQRQLSLALRSTEREWQV